MFSRSVKQLTAMLLPWSVALVGLVPAQAQENESKGQSAETVQVSAQAMERLHNILRTELEAQQFKAQMKDMQSTMSTSRPAAVEVADGPAHSTADSVAPSASLSPTNALLSADDRGVLDYLKGTTINVSVDGYYAWNLTSRSAG